MQRWFLMGVLTFSALHGVLHAEESFQETEIKIEKEDGAEYFEHRVNGVLKEIKVVPKVGLTRQRPLKGSADTHHGSLN